MLYKKIVTFLITFASQKKCIVTNKNDYIHAKHSQNPLAVRQPNQVSINL